MAVGDLKTYEDFSGKVVDENSVLRAVVRGTVDFSVGDNTLVVAQGAGVRVRLLGLIIHSVLAVSVRLKSGPNTVSSTLSLGANGEIVWPYNKHGWKQTEPNEALIVNATVATGGAEFVWIPVA